MQNSKLKNLVFRVKIAWNILTAPKFIAVCPNKTHYMNKSSNEIIEDCNKLANHFIDLENHKEEARINQAIHNLVYN